MKSGRKFRVTNFSEDWSDSGLPRANHNPKTADKENNHEKKKNKQSKLIKYLFFAIPLCIIILALFLFNYYPLKLYKPKNYSLYLSTGEELGKINYNFSDSSLKKKGYTINLSSLNLNGYNKLAFQAKRSNSNGTTNLKVELENNFKEKAEVYISLNSTKWTEYNIIMKDFKNLSELNDIKRLSFIAEEWNAGTKEDTILIDNIRFIRDSKK